MIQTTEREVLQYDVESQIVAMNTIKRRVNDLKFWLDGGAFLLEPDKWADELEKLKYFVREYCRTDDIPAELDELKAKHGTLCDEIEAFEL